MLYIFYGKDQDHAEAKFESLVTSLIAKKANYPVLRFTSDDWNALWWENLLTGENIFGEKNIVTGRQLIANPESKEFLENKFEQLITSANLFILLEVDLPASWIKQTTSPQFKIQKFDSNAKKEKAEFNIFSLGDSLGTHDRRKLWLSFSEARERGIPVEEIFWQFYRQLKNLLLVATAKSDKELSLHPFVFGKIKRQLSKFSVAELMTLTHSLVKMYHEVRAGKREMDMALERWVMEI